MSYFSSQIHKCFIGFIAGVYTEKYCYAFTAKAVVKFGSGEEISLESNITAVICLVKESTDSCFHDHSRTIKQKEADFFL